MKIAIIVGDNYQELEVESFLVSYGEFENVDAAITLVGLKKMPEIVAEGVGRPSAKGILASEEDEVKPLWDEEGRVPIAKVRELNHVQVRESFLPNDAPHAQKMHLKTRAYDYKADKDPLGQAIQEIVALEAVNTDGLNSYIVFLKPTVVVSKKDALHIEEDIYIVKSSAAEVKPTEENSDEHRPESESA